MSTLFCGRIVSSLETSNKNLVNLWKNPSVRQFECPLIWHLPFGSIHTCATTPYVLCMSSILRLTRIGLNPKASTFRKEVTKNLTFSDEKWACLKNIYRIRYLWMSTWPILFRYLGRYVDFSCSILHFDISKSNLAKQVWLDWNSTQNLIWPQTVLLSEWRPFYK